jgi:hypothetical protein
MNVLVKIGLKPFQTLSLQLSSRSRAKSHMVHSVVKLIASSYRPGSLPATVLDCLTVTE